MESSEMTRFRNPTEYLKVFFRRKWLFVAPVYLGLVLGIVACFLLPRAWQSSAIILIEEEKIINPLFQNLAVSTNVEQRMRSIRELLLGWTSLVELTKKLDLAKNITSQLEFEGLIKGLRNNIIVNMRQPNIIQISYIGKNPQETQLIAKTMTDILVERNIQRQTKETDVAIKFINEQLIIYKRKIKESEIAQLEDQLRALLVDSTEQHPLVRELRQKIAIATKELESGQFDVTPGGGKALPNATREALKQELDKIIEKETAASVLGSPALVAEANHDPNASIYKLMLMDKVDSAMARDINVNQQIYNMLLQKLETAKITQRLETSREGTRYTIIDPPRLPLQPVKPNKFKTILLGIFLGAAVGTGLVFAREFLDHSFLDIEDAKLNLESPMLGAISRLTTQEEIDKEIYQKKKLVTIASVSSVVLIIAVMLVSFFTR
jgi:uncharacterized protein involved in exopolysaccharide biosynthesis